MGAGMNIGSISPGAWTQAARSIVVDPSAQQAQASEQADLLKGLLGIRHAQMAASNVSDGKGVDIYM
jgi:hypothetical protein